MLGNTLLSSKEPRSNNWFPKADKSLIVRESVYNGITNTAAPTPANKQRELEIFMRIQKKNEPFDNYKAFERVEYNSMMLAYFSKENMKIVQNAIGAEVYKRTRKIIPYVNSQKLAQCMTEEWSAMLPFDPRNAGQDIVTLNAAVVERFVKNAESNIQFHVQGQQRISTLPVNLFRPLATK